LNYIREQKSRQEFKPVINELVDCAYSEPLHNANNACQQMHSYLLEEAISRSRLPNGSIPDISKLPDNTPLKEFLLTLKNKCKATRLYKKIVRWLNDGRKRKFEYRFTGKETKCFCHKFMYLIDSLTREHDIPSEKLKLTAISFATLHLRDAISRFNRISVDEETISELENHCTLYFNTCSLLLKTVSPSTWTIGYAVPFHTKYLFNQFGLGLGINTMQGREAKHVILASFAKHATHSLRWSLVMRHEYISTIWLRKADPYNFSYRKSKDKYVPEEITQDEFCYCGFHKDSDADKCVYCSSSLYNEVLKTAEQGKLTNDICNLLSVEF